MDVFKAIKSRRSIRNYKDKPIECRIIKMTILADKEEGYSIDKNTDFFLKDIGERK